MHQVQLLPVATRMPILVALLISLKLPEESTDLMMKRLRDQRVGFDDSVGCAIQCWDEVRVPEVPRLVSQLSNTLSIMRQKVQPSLLSNDVHIRSTLPT